MDNEVQDHSEEAERALLGSILLDPERVSALCMEKGLEAEAFHTLANRIAFNGLMWMSKQGMPIDTQILAEQLKKRGQLDTVGGAIAIDRLIDETPTAEHAEYYLDEIHNKWLLRKIAQDSATTLKEARTADVSAQEVLAEHIRRMTKLAEVKGNEGDKDAWVEVRRQHDNAVKGIMPGLMTPWRTFNDKIGGVPFGLVTLVAGRGGTRKSYLANQLVTYAGCEAMETMPGAYFPLEDGAHVAMRRAACMIADVDAWLYLRGKVQPADTDAVEDAAKRLMRSDLDVIGGRGKTAEDLELAISRGVAKRGWRFALIDAFKDIRGAGSDIGIGEVYKSQRLNDIAQRYNIALMVVHHIRKKVGEDDGWANKENQWISLTDIKGRGEITDDARMVCILQCEKFREDDGGPGLKNFKLDCQKNSHGPPGDIKLDLNKETGRFTEARRK